MAATTAYGFVGIEHLFGQRVSQIGVDTIREAIRTSTQAWNDEINILLDNWVERSITTKERVELPGSGSLQPVDERGNPLPVVPSGNYDVGFPIRGGATAWGTDRVSAELITVEEANAFTMDAFRRDAAWVRQSMLAAILTNTSYTYTDRQLGAVTVMPLANDDTVTYLRTGTGIAAIDNHYKAQAAAIADATNPFPVIYDELLEHPSNSGPFVSYVASNLTDAIEGLANFTPITDPDVLPATTRDRLTNSGSNTLLGPGNQIIGKTNRMWIVEWRALPDNYMVSVALGAAPFIRMREYDAPRLKGFFPEFHSPDGNLIENRFLRYAGFGVRNRVAAVVNYVGVSGTYAIPTGFSAPLP